MGLGDTAKKVQRVTAIVEETYERMNQLVGQLQELRDRVETTSQQIESMDRELSKQRAILEAIADQQGLDVEELVAAAQDQQGEDGDRTAADGDAGESDAATAESADSTGADGDGTDTAAGE